MDKKTKTAPQIAEIAKKIVALLEPLSFEDRQKTINGALVMFGEGLRNTASGGAVPQGASHAAAPAPTLIGLSPKGATWIRQNGLTMAEVEQVFDISNQGVTIISSVPGKNRSEQTINAYVLQGISQLLASGDTSFTDKDARKFCENAGCHDKTNHTKYMNNKGNMMTGSKNSGWKLTVPGLQRGAELVKQLTKEE